MGGNLRNQWRIDARPEVNYRDGDRSTQLNGLSATADQLGERIHAAGDPGRLVGGYIGALTTIAEASIQDEQSIRTHDGNERPRPTVGDIGYLLLKLTVDVELVERYTEQTGNFVELDLGSFSPDVPEYALTF